MRIRVRREYISLFRINLGATAGDRMTSLARSLAIHAHFPEEKCQIEMRMENRGALFLCVHDGVVSCRQLKTNYIRKWIRIRPIVV